ncbi:hypothetical protein [Rhizobium lentis]|uniref:hypothetical protein n=1 Tax=Rhizobium lentis TaxID=1138194 RepID=UPI002180A6C4|nr:hypothetical protein [Rhizobium lentis]
MSSFALGYGVLAEINSLSAKLPSLPPIIRYFDDFYNETRSIRPQANEISLELDGGRNFLDFNQFGPAAPVVKHVLVDWLLRVDPHTVASYFRHVRSYVLSRGLGSLTYLVVAPPFDARAHWNTFVLSDVTAEQSWGLRALLHSLCRLNIGHWSPPLASIIRGLKSPKVDTYRVVRAGDCFLPLDQQAMIINHIDAMRATLAADPDAMDGTGLRDTCMLIMSYQYAFRPGQIARIETADVRLYSTGAVHVAVSLIKQKDNSKRIRVTRRIKREW